MHRNSLQRDAVLNSVRRAISIVHGVLTAAIVAGSLGYTALGIWINLSLGRAPRCCVDTVEGPAFELTQFTVGWLMLVAWLGLSLWLPLSALDLRFPSARHKDHWAAAVRVLLGIAALALFVADPTGSLDWFMD